MLMQVYIVYMGSLPERGYSPTSHHLSILQEVVESSSVNDILVRSYSRSFNGFAAKLTNLEQQKIAGMDGVVSVFPRKMLQLQTTRSWDFMGFAETVKRNPSVESDIVIGVLDSGIWPELESFNDEGLSDPPKKWKGVCEGGKNFTCNRKIIGARFYPTESTDTSARDSFSGHGTNIASIAAGKKVAGVDYFGLAKGNVRGGVPSARIAAYKICYRDPWFCPEDIIMAALDDAIADGVDIISISLTYANGTDLTRDAVAIGAYHAMKKGIMTTQAAGNFGPLPTSVASVAPWIFTVAASSIDRKFINKVILGDKTTFVSDSINSFEANAPLVYGKLNRTGCPEFASRRCDLFCLDENLAKGKIVVCDRGGGDTEAFRAGAVGSVSPLSFTFISKPLPFAAYGLRNNEGDQVKAYMNSTKNPQAYISKSEAANVSGAPGVPDFSSRGPNTIIPDIVKPDISAPGVEILAGFSPAVEPSLLPGDKRSVKYSILSGTSVACSHVTGAAAYVKSFHPDWSPSSIKSALMTTAWSINATSNPGGEFAFGAGHIDPVKAISPGLVYEAFADDYVKFLCSLGYDTRKLQAITKDSSTCPSETKGTPKDLNYPSMAARVQENKPFAVNFSRTVTNVGQGNSKYKAKVTVDPKIKINVAPSDLSFKSLKEKQSFVVTVSGVGLKENSMVSASLVWSDGTYNVRSPIVLYTNKGPEHKGLKF
ncbi:hypothetical protein CICLE_v10030114mg [Citrus x clementina]|uniref:Subtilisin-like protease fibronectin type-III domain-containing protein n=3 Tax=Citrus TaxID=2706 RepID=V4RU48_CITCL|nr:hypothetical protein CICLE_v10030114mg [Citrus x clementina]